MSVTGIRDILKGYFKSGAVPNAQQFGELIDKSIPDKIETSQIPKIIDLTTDEESSSEASSDVNSSLTINSVNSETLVATEKLTAYTIDTTSDETNGLAHNLTIKANSLYVEPTQSGDDQESASCIHADQLTVDTVTAHRINVIDDGAVGEIQVTSLNANDITTAVIKCKVNDHISITSDNGNETTISPTELTTKTVKASVFGEAAAPEVTQFHGDGAGLINLPLPEASTSVPGISRLASSTDFEAEDAEDVQAVVTVKTFKQQMTDEYGWKEDGKLDIHKLPVWDGATANDPENLLPSLQHLKYSEAALESFVRGRTTINHVVKVVATTQQSTHSLNDIDGYTLKVGDRVLLTAQSNKKDNRVWIASDGDWQVADDFGSDVNLSVELVVDVEKGDDRKRSIWQLQNITPSEEGDFFELDWQQISDIKPYEAGEGISLNDKTISINETWLSASIQQTSIPSSSLPVNLVYKSNADKILESDLPDRVVYKSLGGTIPPDDLPDTLVYKTSDHKIAITELPIADTLGTTHDNVPTQQAVKEYVDMQLSNSSLPVNSIVMYSGNVAPTGWVICDGAQGSGTPNLLDKFIPKEDNPNEYSVIYIQKITITD